MKAVFSTAVLSAALVSVSLFTTAAAHADTADQIATQAQSAFAKRDYTQAGIQAAQLSADLYEKAAAAAPDQSTPKAQYLILESASLYFVGDASADNSVKISTFLKGESVADQAAKILGIADVPNVQNPALLALKASLAGKPELGLLGDALYYRGINLGQWGQANGVIASLSKWGELRHNMEIIPVLGLASIHDFGSNRVLGRAYTKLPSLAGGDYAKAQKLLTAAVKGSLVPGQIYSRNGNNNIYLADVLHELGDDAQAKSILTAYIKADPKQIDAAAIPETRQAQQAAKDDMAGW